MNTKDIAGKLWSLAGKLSNTMKSSDSAYLLLGLIYIKHCSINSSNQDLSTERIYVKPNSPYPSLWNHLKSNSEHVDLITIIYDALYAIEQQTRNSSGPAFKNHNFFNFDRSSLSLLIESIDNISFSGPNNSPGSFYDNIIAIFLKTGEGIRSDTSNDFARLLVELLEPDNGKLYDLHCGSGQVLVDCKKYLDRQKGKIENLQFFGQDSDSSLVRLAKMNLAVRGIKFNIEAGSIYTKDFNPDLKADFIFSNLTIINKRVRNKAGVSQTESKRNADFSEIEFVIEKLSPSGTAAIVFTNNFFDTNFSWKSRIKKDLVDNNLLDCVITLPTSTNLLAGENIYIITKNKSHRLKHRNREKEILFIDAGKLTKRGFGLKELTAEHIALIAATYHKWRNINGDYFDIQGYCFSVATDKIKQKNYALKPENYFSKNFYKTFVLTLLTAIVLLPLLYFFILKPNFFVSKTEVASRTVIQTEDTIKVVASANSTIRKAQVENKKETKKDTPIIVKENLRTEEESIKSETLPIEEQKEEKLENKKQNTSSYKVISKAYFYNEPDANTQREAYIIHWNNSYAKIEALEERNGFIYVVFKNHLNQVSKGWLRKRDLRKVN